MFVRSVTLGFDASTSPTSQSGIVLAAPGSPLRDKDDFIYAVHGSVRVAATDIEVERMEVLRGVMLTMIFSLSQAPLTVPLVATRLLFPDDVADVGTDVVAGFQCEIEVRPAPGAFYLHAAFRQYVSNVVRLEAPPRAG